MQRQVDAIDRPPLDCERICWPDYKTWLVRTTEMYLENIFSQRYLDAINTCWFSPFPESMQRQVDAIDRPPLDCERICWPDYRTWLVRTTDMYLEYMFSHR